MSEIEFQSGDATPEASIPENLRPRVGAEAPERLKGLIARAVVPMPPEELGLALAVLARDTDLEVSGTAVNTIRDLSPAVVQSFVTENSIGPILDVYAHVFHDDVEVLQRLIANGATLDVTVAWIARTLRGPILDVVASNQVRLVRAPIIIDAIINNTAAPTPLLARVVETAIRNRVDTKHIVGFRELAKAFFGDLQGNLLDESEEIAEETEEIIEIPDEVELVPIELDDGLDEDEFEAILTGASGVLLEEDGRAKPLWKALADMSVPQKVRLALLGDAGARKILIRDPKKTVSMSVLRSPKLTYKEIAVFAQDKSLDAEIIRKISASRAWTKHYSVVHNLVLNPKCPPNKVMNFLSSLRHRDLQGLSKAKEVPNSVRTAAKQLMEKRSQR